LDTLDGAIGLGPAGMDEAVLSGDLGCRLAKELGAELGAVVGGDALEWPASN